MAGVLSLVLRGLFGAYDEPTISWFGKMLAAVIIDETIGNEYTAKKRAAKPRKLCTAAAMIEQPHRGLVHLRQMR